MGPGGEIPYECQNGGVLLWEQMGRPQRVTPRTSPPPAARGRQRCILPGCCKDKCTNAELRKATGMDALQLGQMEER